MVSEQTRQDLQPTPWQKENSAYLEKPAKESQFGNCSGKKKRGGENYNSHGAHSLASTAHCNGSSGHTPSVLSCCGTVLELSVRPAKRPRAFPGRSMTLVRLMQMHPHPDADIQPVSSFDELEVSLPTKAPLLCSQCQRECHCLGISGDL